jgi:hypothetical protein
MQVPGLAGSPQPAGEIVHNHNLIRWRSTCHWTVVLSTALRFVDDARNDIEHRIDGRRVFFRPRHVAIQS